MADAVQRVQAGDLMKRSLKAEKGGANAAGTGTSIPTRLDLGLICIEDKLRSRAAYDHAVIAEYAAALAEGAAFPPVVVFFDGESHWLADGFYRVFAAQVAELDAVDATVRAGSFSDALLYSAGANTRHGLRRTNADKRLAVRKLLEDPEWSKWSDREIARQCAVDNSFVSKLHKELDDRKALAGASTISVDKPQTRLVKREGKVFQMRTGAIGAPKGLPPAITQLLRDTDFWDDPQQVRALAAVSEKRQQALAEVIAEGHVASLLDAQRVLRIRAAEAATKKRQDDLRASGFVCNEFVQGDCRTELAKFASRNPKACRLLLCDPPYGMNLKNKHRVASADAPPIEGDCDLRTALNLLRDMLSAIDSAMSDECHALIFSDRRYAHLFSRVIRRAGYNVRDVLVWDKQRHGVGFTGDFAPSYEAIIHAVRGGATISPRLMNVLSVPAEHSTSHICEKPTELLRQLIDCTTLASELVLDPFAGTAATLVAAAQLGRRYFGVERETPYYLEGLARLQALQSPTTWEPTADVPVTVREQHHGSPETYALPLAA
jgi:hypothetical protein